MNKRELGKQFELSAQQLLQNLGYTLLAKNFFGKSGEIDLIMQHKGEIVFVEVKSLSINSTFSIYSRISGAKKARIVSTGIEWLIENNSIELPWRIDFIGIIYNNERILEFVHEKRLSYNDLTKC